MRAELPQVPSSLTWVLAQDPSFLLLLTLPDSLVAMWPIGGSEECKA